MNHPLSKWFLAPPRTRRAADDREHLRSRDCTPVVRHTGAGSADALPSTGPGNLRHIPYFAIGCMLDSIASRSDGRMTVEVIGQSAPGRDLYLVTINEQKTSAGTSPTGTRFAPSPNPAQAQTLLDGAGRP